MSHTDFRGVWLFEGDKVAVMYPLVHRVVLKFGTVIAKSAKFIKVRIEFPQRGGGTHYVTRSIDPKRVARL